MPAIALPTIRQARLGDTHSMTDPAQNMAAPIVMMRTRDILSDREPANSPEIVDVMRIVLWAKGLIGIAVWPL